MLLAFAALLLTVAHCVAAPLPADVVARIDRYVEEERARSRIPGIAVAIVHEGRIAHVRGYGSRGDGQPVTGTTPFPIGSLTKSFTALLVRQLVDAGRIDVDAPLQRYLPWFGVADADAAARITVRHLLNQTSGLSQTAGVQPLLRYSETSIEQLARGTASPRLASAPGTRYEYSNLNFVLLGALVEAVLRQPWSEALRQRVLQPLDLRHTYTDHDVARRNGMSALHRYWFGVPVARTPSFTAGMAPAGVLVASAQDLAAYLVMLVQEGQGASGPLLSRQAVSAMLAAGSPPAQGTLLSTTFNFRYGEGWFVGPFGAMEDARWHLGSLSSFTAWMVLSPGARQGVVVLLNANSQLPLFQMSATFSRIPIGVVNLLAGKPAPTGPSVVDAYVTLIAVGLLLGSMLAMLAWWVARHGPRWAGSVLALAAVGSAFGIAATGLGWRGFAQFAPDLTLGVVATLLVMFAAWFYQMVRR